MCWLRSVCEMGFSILMPAVYASSAAVFEAVEKALEYYLTKVRGARCSI